MTTLASPGKLRTSALGDISAYPVIASDIIWPGAAVGIVDATGHARPLTSVDRFAGFAAKKVDNSTGSAADKNVDVDIRGVKVLDVSGSVITDIGQPVYATDDDTFVFSPVGAVFIGKVTRWVSAGKVEVQYDALNQIDPYGGRVWETYSASSTLDKQDTGKGFWVDTDAQTMTLLTYNALTAINIFVVNGGAFGTIAVTIDPAGADLISGPDDTGSDGGAMVNTKLTARRGDSAKIVTGGDEGYLAETRGIWTIA